MRKISISGIVASISGISREEKERVKSILTWEEKDEEKCLYKEVEGDLIVYKNYLPILFDDYKLPKNEILFAPKTSEISVPGIELYSYQKRAIQQCLVKRFGGILSGTGSGKTEMIAGFFLYLFQNTNYKNMWIVVNNSLLAGNIYARLLARGLPPEEVHLYDSKKRNGLVVSKRLVIVVVNSIHAALKRNTKLLQKKLFESEVVVVDEAHHATQMLYNMLSYCSNLKFLLGFSATLFENPGDPHVLYGDAQVYGLFGRILKEVSVSDLQEAGRIATPFLYLDTVGSSKICNKYSGLVFKYNTVYTKLIVDNNFRNSRIALFASYMADRGLQTFISVIQHDHAFNILGKLKKYRVVAIFGGGQTVRSINGDVKTSIEDYEKISEEYRKGKIDILIASTVADEGFDLPSVDCMIMGGAGKAFRKVNQRRGRGARRKSKGLNNFLLIDFWDKTHKYLLKHSEIRLNHYVKDAANITYSWEEFSEVIEKYCKEKNDAN